MFLWDTPVPKVWFINKESVELYAPLLYMQALGKPL